MKYQDFMKFAWRLFKRTENVTLVGTPWLFCSFYVGRKEEETIGVLLYIQWWETFFRVEKGNDVDNFFSCFSFKVSFILQINYFSGKVSEEALTEEEQLNDLLLLIKLLTNLLSKDIIDFGSGQ